MKNLRRLACKFDLNQSERKSMQVHASPGQTKSQVDLSLQLASTCVNLRLHLARALLKWYFGENLVFPFEAILNDKQVVNMRRKMPFTTFNYLISFQRYSSF